MANIHQHLGILLKYTAKFHSPTQLILYQQSPRRPLLGGHVNHGIRIIIRSRKAPNWLFHSLLLCIEAKF
ncbi:hypothetical protein BYT27DRAFT_7326612 [Phlegmacium glaucopus]|nr:hypothetical protein BYT27DRAFT_7326612 [Phlegmacium glaucopus]